MRHAFLLVAVSALVWGGKGLAQGDTQRSGDSAKRDSASAPQAEVVSLPTPEERIADYTLWLTIVTGGLVVVTFLQLLLLRSQHRLSERQVAAMLRPRLTLRRITYAKPEGGRTPALLIELADIGSDRANIEAAICAVVPTDRPRDREPWRLLEALDKARNWAPAEVPRSGSLVVRRVIDPSEDTPFAMAEYLYCVGYIVYSNAARTGLYRMGFIRCADPRERVFRPVDNHDFEYAD